MPMESVKNKFKLRLFLGFFSDTFGLFSATSAFFSLFCRPTVVFSKILYHTFLMQQPSLKKNSKKKKSSKTTTGGTYE